MGDSCRAKKRTMSKIYLGNLSSNVDDRDIEDTFGKFGRIENIWIARKPPGFAFVTYDDPRDAEDATREMDGRELDRERLTDPYQKIRVEVSQGGGGGKGGGRYDDRGGGGKGKGAGICWDWQNGRCQRPVCRFRHGDDFDDGRGRSRSRGGRGRSRSRGGDSRSPPRVR